jgi:ABC transporter substrate binding protein
MLRPLNNTYKLPASTQDGAFWMMQIAGDLTLYDHHGAPCTASASRVARTTASVIATVFSAACLTILCLTVLAPLFGPLVSSARAESRDLVVFGSIALQEALNEVNDTIPIVMTGTSDPVGTGFVASLARPGANITGLSLLSPELSGKRLQLLREITKHRSSLAILSNPDDPAVVFSLRETEKAARASGLEINVLEARNGEDLSGAFETITKKRPEALVILPASLVTRYAARIAELALNRRIPAMSYFRDFPAVA